MRGCGVWKYHRDYFPVSLVKTAELPPDKNYLLCSYPHGIIGTGVISRQILLLIVPIMRPFITIQDTNKTKTKQIVIVHSFGTDSLGVRDLFPGTTPSLVTLRQNFNVPILREILLSQG